MVRWLIELMRHAWGNKTMVELMRNQSCGGTNNYMTICPDLIIIPNRGESERVRPSEYT